MSWSHRFPRQLLLLSVVPLATACSNVGGDLSSVLNVAETIWKGPQPVTLEEAASVPYASIGVKMGGYSQIMLILATDAEGQRLWTSDARIAIVTAQDGHIVHTSGLGRDLSSMRFLGTSHPGNAGYSWEADFKDLGIYAVTGNCRRIAERDETITILGTPLNTRRIDERCQSDNNQMNWSFRNTYWLDSNSGFPWRSVQHLHPKLPAVEITVLRPPSGSFNSPNQQVSER